MTPDYIVVGAGSAGCVLARRLSEDPNNKVLLLEAGGKPNWFSKVPGLYSLLHTTKMNWGFWTEPQAHANGRKIFIPRGKALGGSSATNAMAYVRGNRQDYDTWAALGNTGWDYASVLPYFKRSERHLSLHDDVHGQAGELRIDFSPRYFPMTDCFMDACKDAGIPFNPDYNGANQEGASYLQYTIDGGKRENTYDAFLAPVCDRSNLHIRTGAMVKRIVVQDQKAKGVEVYTGKNTTEMITCNKEIILAAGAIQSPQLLQVSGIGDPDELRKWNIDVVADLPGVGQNLQDHVWSGTSDYASVLGINATLKKSIFVRELFKHWRRKPSMMDNSIIEGNAFVRSSDKESSPDLQFHFAPVQLGTDYNDTLYDALKLPTENGYSILAILIQPKSRGSVRLRSADVRDVPVIQPNFLSDPADVQTLLVGMKKTMSILDSAAFDTVRGDKMDYPPRNSSDEALIEHIKNTLETLYHPVGTCKMGNGEDAVVDAKLRVRGMEGLRVADASIMPTIVRGNTNAACIMIGEKAADLVLKG